MNGDGPTPGLSLVPKQGDVIRASPATIDLADFTSDVIRQEAPRARAIEVRDHGQLLAVTLSATELKRYRNMVRSKRAVRILLRLAPDDVLGVLPWMGEAWPGIGGEL